MSTTLGEPGTSSKAQPGPSGPLALMVAIPLAGWRLSRLLSHLIVSQVRSYLVWPSLDEQGWHHETLSWSRKLLDILGISLHVQGQATPGAKLVVSNHISWLDIVAINAVVPSRFVSKAEVAHWPLVGRLVTAAGTLYLVRERRRDAMRVLGLMAQALREGHTVAVFPEGTTGSGHELMHFHANLLQAAIDAPVSIQPVVLRYSDPAHAVSPIAAYVGDTTLMQSLWWVVTARGLAIHAQILPQEDVSQGDRRALAQKLHVRISQALSNANH